MTDPAPRLVPLRSTADAERWLGGPLALLYKHSPWCGLSTGAEREVRDFLASAPALSAAWVDVVRDRAVARYVEERTGVRHESPQVLLVAGGRVLWHASHRGVTRAALAAASADVRPAG